MKVIALNGSPRKDGNTSIMLETISVELKKEGVETEIIQIGGLPIRGCQACNACFKNLDKKCVIKDDIVNECIEKTANADGLILGSPIYFTGVTTEMKAFIDRSGFVALANGGLFKYKVASAVTAVRRGGATHAFDTMNHYFHLNQMIMVGASYWNMAYGLKPGDVKTDSEGMGNMNSIAQNMAWLLKKIKA